MLESKGKLSNMATRTHTTPDDAREALEQVTHSRHAIARQASTPWWYRVGAATCTAAMFAGVGLLVGPPGDTESTGTLLVAVGAAVGPAALLAALRHSSGISLDRYARGLNLWYVLVFSLFAAGLGLQALADVPYALPVAGIPAFIATLVTERRIDARLRERLRAGTASV